MKILLTGATGFLGYRCLEKMIEVPFIQEITATGRTLRPERRLTDSKVTYQLGDLLEEGFIDGLMEGVEVIVHTAALSSPWGKASAFVAANIEVQNRLIKAAQKFGVARFIFISTPSLYFTGEDRLGIKESDPLPTRFINFYASTKREAEKALMTSEIPYVIFRPRALIGRGDTVILPRLLRAYDAGRLRVIGNGKNLVDLTPVANVVNAIILSLRTQRGLNQTFNISNGEPVAIWPLVNKVLDRLGREPLRKKVPIPVALVAAGIMETKSRWTDYAEPVLTKYSVGTLARSFSLDISKARELLDYRPEMDVEEGMNEFINWYQKDHEAG